MTHYILYYDFAAFFVTAMLLLSIFLRGLQKDKASRRITALIIILMLTIQLDIITIWLNRFSGLTAIKYLANLAFIALTHTMMPLYIWYIYSFTHFRIKITSKIWTLIFLPYALTNIGTVLSCFTHWFFYIDDAGQYTRGPLFWFYYVESAFYICYNIVHLIKNRKILGTGPVVALSSFIISVFTAAIIQYVHPEQLVQLFAISVAITLVMLSIQRPEAYLDTNTGAKNDRAFVRNLEIAAFHSNQLKIIVVNIGNFHTFTEMLGISKTILLMKQLTVKINSINPDGIHDYLLFYLKTGQFRIIMNTTSDERVNLLASNINDYLKEPFYFNEMTLQFNAAVCIADYPNDAADPDSMMLLGGDVGENIWGGEVVYASKIFVKDRYNLSRQMDTIIASALTNHYFEVYYQPIYSTRQKRFTSAEALLRLKDPTHGFISPEIFIPAAEKSGAIHAIGEYVITSVCDFISSPDFSKLGLEYIEINLSVAQCMRQNLASEVMGILRSKRVNPKYINLEITETAASFSQNMLTTNMDKLHSEGIAFSLDDYGTGYSNIQRVASMPFKLVKFDKTFVDLRKNGKIQTILDNSIRMINALNMEIVIEGVETKDMLDQFTELGCDFIQGYYFSRPLPRDEFITFITNSLS